MNPAKDDHKYDDIIHLPHPVSCKRTRMSVHDRAAQFSAFAALTGFDAAIAETARLTEDCIELDEGGKALLNEKLQWILEMEEQHPAVTVVCFRPDCRKIGGEYVRITGAVKKIDPYAHTLVMQDGEVIPISRIYDIYED